MNSFRNFNLTAATAAINLTSYAIQDFNMVTPTLAHVLVTTSGDITEAKDEVRAGIAQLFSGLATPVADSFRKVTANTFIGFVRSASDTREFAESEVANFKEVASNLLMDKEDESLWDVRKGTTGTYLVRHGNEDLSELASTVRRRQASKPTFSAIASVEAEPKEFAAFIDVKSEEVEHGYVVESNHKDGYVNILPVGGDALVKVEARCLIDVRDLQGADTKAMGIQVAAASLDANALIEYYRKAYPYAPDYVQSIIDMINQHSVA